MFIAISTLISLIISILLVPTFFSIRDTGLFPRGIAPIWFFVSYICFVFLTSGLFDCSEFLRNRNDKIDEEEKARQQALLLETEEKLRTQSQIWVNE